MKRTLADCPAPSLRRLQKVTAAQGWWRWRTQMDTRGKCGHAIRMETAKRYGSSTTIGWIVTLVGCALWSYGYFVGGSSPFLNWPAFSPHWIADYLPNWQAETGLLLTLVASIPIYYGGLQISHQKK